MSQKERVGLTERAPLVMSLFVACLSDGMLEPERAVEELSICSHRPAMSRARSAFTFGGMASERRVDS